MRNTMPTVAAMLAVATVLFVSGCTTQELPGGEIMAISTFEDCAAAGYPVMESYPMQCRTPGPDGQTFTEIIDDGNGGSGEEPGPIGGQRDGHGCLGPAGYSWNESVGACIRPWELDESQKEAAGIAVGYLGWEYATTVTGVATARCPGCFSVTVEQGEAMDRFTVSLSNWTVTEKTWAYHQCTDAEKAAEICTMEYMPVCGRISDGSSKTYGNMCGACSAGAGYWESGECEA